MAGCDRTNIEAYQIALYPGAIAALAEGAAPAYMTVRGMGYIFSKRILPFDVLKSISGPPFPITPSM